MTRKTREVRWVVVKDYMHESIGNCQDTYPILYGNKDEANACYDRLQAGGDKSWFDPGGPEQAILFVDNIEL